MKTEELYKLYLQHPKITTDTRKTVSESIFFALKGESFDGNQYAQKAIEMGAKYAVVDNPGKAINSKYILVSNVLVALQELAAFHRQKQKNPVIAITGSNGKTTTKELIAAVLSKKYNTRYTRGNLNNHIGVPLTLLEIDDKTEIAIIEMGANHPGEINLLCKMADPDFGIITNIGKAHLEGFGSLENIIQTKTELYRHLESKKGKIFINADDNLLNKVKPENLDAIKFGNSFSVSFRGEIVNQTPYLNLKVWFKKGVLYLNSKLIGSYNLENILAAACIGNYFNVDPIQIQEAINNYYPSNYRSQLIKKGSNKIIMDAYNANPTSMLASLKNFMLLNEKTKVLLLGDMLELGSASHSEHQAIVDLIKANSFDEVYLVGPNFVQTKHPASIRVFENTESLNVFLKANHIKNSLILVKGSRGIQLEKTLEFI